MGTIRDEWDDAPVFEVLEPRLLLSGSVVISEFMASNDATLFDGDGNSSDWIELHNPTDAPVSLDGWYLTDKTGNLDKWQFPDETPDITIAPGGYLVVFASDGREDVQDPVDPYKDPQGNLHTNFKLSKENENVLLVRDDGLTVEHGYEDYPEQFTDISYGIYLGATWDTLVGEGASLSYHVPTAGDTGLLPGGGDPGWTAVDFDDSAWTDSMVFGATGIVVTEINTGDPNFVEIQNVSDQAIDTTDWLVLVNNGSVGINSVNAVAWQLPGSIASEQVLFRTDDPTDGDDYWGGDILWDIEGPGWAMVIDDVGEVMDFVAWDYSAAQIASLDISYGGFAHITVGEQWSGAGANLIGGGEPGAAEDAIEFGAAWNYLHPLNGADPASSDFDFNTTWMQADGYNGPAFSGLEPGLLGYGAIAYGPIATNIGTPPSGSRYTGYFRSEFVLDDPMVEVAIEILNDDGAFIYIDGVEVARNNISVGKSDAYFVFADNHTYPDGTNVENETRTLSITDLDAGAHTIAVSVHQANTGSSDLGLDLRLFGRPVAGGELLRRTGRSDGETASDFEPNNDPTKGAQNPGLTVPFGAVLDTTTGIGFSDSQQAFEDIIESDVGEAMQDVNASLWTRIEFLASDDLSVMGTLTLNMMYDDGFVAYLNGVQVAQQNDPPALAWDSAATAAHADGQAVVYENIDITAYIGLLLDGTNVLAIHGLNFGASDADLLIKPKLVAMGDVSMPRHFAVATPDQANNEEWWRYVEDTAFDHDRGFYTDPFDLVISTDTVGAQIYYTTNGTSPLMSNGSIHVDATEYTAPISISTTTVVRAVAVKATYAPTNVDTQTYLFLNDIINQPTNPTGFPSSWGGTTADYQMDPDVVFNPTYQAQMIDSLLSIPTMSISMDVDDMFGSSGIYANPGGRGLGWERETSLEYFDPNSTDEFQVDAGLRMYGGAFRTNWGLTRKKSFRLLFKGDYGPTKLNFPLFDAEGAATSFDNIVLRAGANDGWNNWGKANTQYIIDEYMRQLQLALEQPSGHGTFVHLYINGLYWGLYNPIERPEASFCATYFGGDKEDWDALNSGSPTGESNTATWSAMLGQVRAGPATDEAYQKIQGNNPDGTNNPAYNDMLDVDNYIAYMFSNIWGGTGDWPGHNWYAAAHRPPDDTGWKFFNWDAEGAICVWSSLGANRTGVNNSAAEPYAWLRGNAEFNLLFGDYAHQWLFNNGPAAYGASYTRYQQLAYEVESAIIAESARWGDQGSSTPYTLAHWTSKRDEVLYDYMPYRPDEVLDQLKGAGLYPNTIAPSFNINGSYQHGGQVLPGAELSMPSGAGTIYYTTDGTDPRAVGGDVVGTPYSSGQTILLTESTRVLSRRYSGGQWSALNAATFYVNPPVAGELAITELNYNPYAPTNEELLTQPPEDEDFTAGDFEFVELLNTSDRTINLLDVEFSSGVEFMFSPGPLSSLSAGQYAVIVANTAAFEARYGASANVVGVYSGSLDNAGEAVALAHPLIQTLEAFEYKDGGAWPNRADGGGSSLVLIDPTGDLGKGANWRSSSEYGGSPGRAGAGARSDVIVNEVLTHTDDPQVDTIELHNTTGAPINIGGWFLSDSKADYAKFEIPADTEIPAGGYVVFYEGHYDQGVLEVDYATEFGGPGEKDFALSGLHGDDVWLLEADASGKLLSFVDHAEFGGAANGVSFGRWSDAVGDLYPMTSVTLGGTNSPPRVGPVIISEVMYNPPDPDGLGGVDPDDLEFIEIYNPTLNAIPLAAWTDNPHAAGQYFADWRLRGGVDMEFDEGTTIAAAGILVVLSFDPNKPENATRVAGFRTYYGIDASVPLAGGYGGKLNDDGERIKLQRPDSPSAEEPAFVPHLLEDRVNYDDTAPWPISPDGYGDSLHRVHFEIFGGGAPSWRHDAPTPGIALPFSMPPIVVTPIADVTVDEDSGASVRDVSATFDDPDPGDTLTLSVRGNTNAGMVTTDLAAGILTLSYVADQNGTADIAVRATDQVGAWTEDIFTVTVTFINDAPPTVTDPVADVTVDEDAADSVVYVSNVFDDVDFGDTLVLSVTGNTNTGLVATSIVGGHLTLSYVSDQNGTADITVRATDSGGLWVEDTFTVTVDPANDAPTAANPIADVAVDEDAADIVVDLSNVFDDIDVGDTLSLAVWTNTDTGLVTTNLIGTNLTLSFVADQNGTADITIRATDSGTPSLWVEDTFRITVNPVNDTPVMNELPNRSLNEDGSLNTAISLWGYASDVEDSDAQMTFSIIGDTNSNCGVSIDTDRFVDINPASNWCGYSDVTIQVQDLNGASDTGAFRITVNPVNDAPFVDSPVADFTVDEDNPETMPDLSAVFDDIDLVDSLTLSIEGNTNPGLVTTNLIDDELTLSYAPDGNGWASITVGATDSEGASVTDTFTVTVNPVNDAPTAANPIDDVFVFENDPDTVLNLESVFADVDAGDSLTLSVAGNTNSGLVTMNVVGSQLTLSYVADQFGTAEITIRATDSGLPALWVEDTFAVAVSPDNFPPTVANPIADVTVDEDAADTVLDLSNVFDDTAGFVPDIDYTAVEINPVTGAPAAGTGLFAYTFTLYGHDGVDASFATTSLTFTGPIQQIKAFVVVDVNYESTALLLEGVDDSDYIAALDTWMFDGWQGLPPTDTDVSGPTVIVSVGSGTSTFYQEKDVVYIVAAGDVQWTGLFARRGETYETSGTTVTTRLTLSVEGNTNPGLVTASLLGSQLTLSYTPEAIGIADITIRATDDGGAWVEDVFTVTVDPVSDVAGRHVFYNNSAWDAGGDDDAAIAPDKSPLLPGGIATLANYTTYSGGVNGIMVDIDGPIAAPTAGDFGIRVNEAAVPDTWSAGPTPIVSVRPGEGVGGSDRVTLIWGDGEIRNRWVEVTVKSTGNINLAADDVFYFGNAVGDCDGDGQIGSDDYETMIGEFGQRGGMGALATDLNGDGRVDLTDFAIMRGAYGNSVLAPTIPAAALQAVAEPIAEAAAPVVPVVSQPLDDIIGKNANDDSIAAAALAPPIDLLMQPPSPVNYISGPQPISVGSSATMPYRAATREYDLRPLGDDLPTDGEDDLLADILAESPLAVPL